MHWVTRSHLHLDRVATPWLIHRFVDPDATFGFAPWGEAPAEEQGVVVFGFPGIELSSHDAGGTTFAKVLRRYALDDPALERMERIVAAGVRHALGHDPAPDESEDETMLGAALDRLGVGLGVAFDDAEHLERAMGLYEAVYVLCRIAALPEDIPAQAPGSLPARIAFLRSALTT